MLASGEYSLAEVGKKLGITRQRVSQLYGRSYRKYINKKITDRRFLKEKTKEFHDKMIKFKCQRCKASIQAGDPNFTFKCENCGVKFHPLKNWKQYHKKRTKVFHSLKCYLEYKKGGAKK